MVGKHVQVAIDGPVGAGKSTVAKKVAMRMGFLFIDTGAMYRAVALESKRKGVDWKDEERVSELVEDLKIELVMTEKERDDERGVVVYLDGKDVSWETRESGIGEGASVVSQYRKVREELVKRQREMARERSVVMEGRDIGTNVLPKADLKIYLTADVDERVKRKVNQLKKRGKKESFEEVKEGLMKRDKREKTREINPLRPADGAWIFDTTDLSENQVVDRICRRVADL